VTAGGHFRDYDDAPEVTEAAGRYLVAPGRVLRSPIPTRATAYADSTELTDWTDRSASQHNSSRNEPGLTLS
jgi:hypothetical protein